MVSPAYKAAFYAPETDEVTLFLVTLEHAALTETVYVVGDPQPLTHLGQLYRPAGFGLQLPEETDGPALAQVVLENISRDLVAALRLAEGAPRVSIKEVLASDPDVVEDEWPDFDLIDATYDAAQIVGSLAYPDLAQMPFGGQFLPSQWPGLF